MSIHTIVHFEIPAKNVKKLSAFYTRCFGWKFEHAPIPGMDYWLTSTGPVGKGVTGGMYRKMGPKDGIRNYISVDDIDAAIRTFRAAGGKQVVPKMAVPEMGWSFVGTDPEGNLVALFEPTSRRRAATRRKK